MAKSVERRSVGDGSRRRGCGYVRSLSSAVTGRLPGCIRELLRAIWLVCGRLGSAYGDVRAARGDDGLVELPGIPGPDNCEDMPDVRGCPSELCSSRQASGSNPALVGEPRGADRSRAVWLDSATLDSVGSVLCSPCVELGPALGKGPY